MDFSLTDDQRALRDAARDFAANEFGDKARELEETNTPVAFDDRMRMGEYGFLGVNLPTEYGGLGLDDLTAVLILEQYAKISPAIAFPVFESCFGPAQAIERFGTETLKRRILPRICRGRSIVSIAMSEPGAGSALTDLGTRGEINGAIITLNGQKRWCSGAGHADGYLVYCRLSDEPGAKGIGAVFVDADKPGLSFGEQEQLMGFRGIPSADIYFDNVEVGKDDLVAGAGGFRRLMEAFDLERCGNATMSLAIAQSALDHAIEYVQEREQFGRPIVEFQAVQLKLANMAMKVEAARLLIYRAVVNVAKGFPSAKDSSIAKCFANEMVREVTGDALQVMGGYGYHKDYGMERRLRDAWGWGIAGGTIDIQKTNIASALVGRRFSQRRERPE